VAGVTRAPGLSVRWKLTLSYAGFLMTAGTLLMVTVWVFLLRYVPDHPSFGPGPASPTRADLLAAFAPRAAQALLVLLVVGLAGGWLLAGRMLSPLARITEATRIASTGSLSHRIRLEGRSDEFRELADAFDSMLARLEAQVAEQQRFAANASHELRTPLAITQTLLDVARRDPDRDTDTLVNHLHDVNSRAISFSRRSVRAWRLMRVYSRAFSIPIAIREPISVSNRLCSSVKWWGWGDSMSITPITRFFTISGTASSERTFGKAEM